MNRLLQVPDINANDVREADALQRASRTGKVAVVDRLLRVPGINADDVSAHNNYALSWASQNGHVAVVDRLLEVPGITRHLAAYATYADDAT